MSAPTAKFALLLDLAQETSSERRRDLLREITNMLVRDPSVQTLANCSAFDEIAVAVIADLKSEARSEISQMVADTTLPLGRTARQLALDDIAIARPVLERSAALTDKDLVDVASTQSQDHLMAVTRRSSIAEIVADALVTHGEDRVVVSLLGNSGAQIARDTYERVAVRAESNAILQAPLIRRQGVPLDLLNHLYVAVAPVLRQEILKQYENVSPAELEAALERSRKRVAKAYGGLPDDLEAARLELRKLERAGDIQPPLLVRLMREGAQSRTLFLLAFAQLTEAEYPLVRRLVDTRDIDAMALLCRAAGFERALFVTLSLLVANDEGRANLEEFGRLYERVPVATAQRAVRFWKVRAAA
jgi:uncharacterized protein (DUF2336 family)